MKLPHTPIAILQATTEVWGVSPTQGGRGSQVVSAKQTATLLMLLADEEYTSTDIGKFLNRDPSTMRHIARSAKERFNTSTRFAAMVRRVVALAREMGARVPEGWEE